jgi:hypothetical protein
MIESIASNVMTTLTAFEAGTSFDVIKIDNTR